MKQFSKTRTLALGLILIIASGCASSETQRQRGDRTVITAEQLQEQNFQTAYEAVNALRSNWLRRRGIDSFRAPGQVMVYHDDMRLGGVGALRQIRVDSIAFIRYYDGEAASARWGLDHGHGVIYVSSRPLDR